MTDKKKRSVTVKPFMNLSQLEGELINEVYVKELREEDTVEAVKIRTTFLETEVATINGTLSQLDAKAERNARTGADNIAHINQVEQDIHALSVTHDSTVEDLIDLTTSHHALDMRVSALAADKVTGGGSSGGTYVLPIASASTLGGIKIGSGLNINSAGVLSAPVSTPAPDPQVNTNKADISALNTELDAAQARLTALESGGTLLTKFYILPIAGQSNSMGFGEDPYTLTGEFAPDPRIKQLGRYTTGATVASGSITVTEAAFNYGDRFAEMRPHTDCNLQLIPAAPCLDHIQQIFYVQTGGLAGFGLGLAKLLLPYIPADYGILIVPCGRGGVGFTSGAVGTYDETLKQASANAAKWGAEEPLGKDLRARILHCLDLNPENRMLPIIWAQGEADAGSNKRLGHYTAFKALVDAVISDLTPYADRFPQGDISNFRWFCLSSTKWMYNGNLNKVYATDTAASSQNTVNRGGIYDNYVQLSNEYKQANGRSQIIYVGVDREENGNYTQTNRESGNGSSTSTREIHFSTYANGVTLPRLISNAIFTYGDVVGFRSVSQHAAATRGNLYTVMRDGTTTTGTTAPIPFDMTEGLVIYQNFATATAVLDTEFLASTATVTAHASLAQPSLEADTNFTQVARYVKATKHAITYNANITSGSHTRSVVFKPNKACWGENSNILSAAASGSNSSGITWLVNGVLQFCPDWGNQNQIFCIPCSETNIWNGGFEGWQHLVTAYDHNSRLISIYLNGIPIGSQALATGRNHLCNSLNLGTYAALYGFDGVVANARIYNRALSPSEVAYLSYSDYKRYL